MHMPSRNNLPSMFNNFAKIHANILISKYKPVVYDISLLEMYGFQFFVYLHMASFLLLLNRSGRIRWVRMLLSIYFFSIRLQPFSHQPLQIHQLNSELTPT